VSAPPLPVSGPPSVAPTSGAGTHMDSPVSPAVPAGVTSAVTMTAPPRRKRRWPAVLLSLLALAAVGAGAGWIYLQDRGADTVKTVAPSASPSPDPTGAPVTEEYVHPTLGFRLRVPSTWSNRYIPDIKTTRFNVLSGPGRTDPKLINATNNLYVAVQLANGRDAVQLAEIEDRKWSSDPAFANYQQLRLGPVSLGSHQGSLLEFTYDNAVTGPRHVLVFRTVVKDMSYEVSLNGPGPLFEKDLGVFDDAVDSLVITAA
jgi:hypothetical protein